MKLLIVPDVHGRTFWKNEVYQVIENKDDIHIIFLGDYVDPYPSEGITPEDAIPVLNEIIDLKKRCPNQITLLLGNHDIHYLYPGAVGSRFDRENAMQLEQLFNSNLELFDMTYETIINDKVFYISHAGVTQPWLNKHAELFNLPSTEEEYVQIVKDYKELPNFNDILKNNRAGLFKTLGDVSFYRWGSDKSGSIVWADWKDHLHKEDRIPGIVQIFGHSQQESDPINLDNEVFCLDVRRCFYIDDNGEIIDSSTSKSIPAEDSETILEKEIKKLEALIASGVFAIF